MRLDSITPTVVPEPLTILGAGTAIGFGTAFKKKLGKNKKKK
ncbi:MAG: PEP-CTERM sorting domain-containing protein [Crocosphaera sp.]|nr:PEP-CTERM sorting domain-containing protein [Crocosphaera sp.]MCH2248071.1 PEP-CTERM sorting domain-containing protein [Crocosphaera sp.]